MKSQLVVTRDVLKQARATKSYEEFGALAEKASDDEWRVMMGDTAPLKKEDAPPSEGSIRHETGQISDLIRAEILLHHPAQQHEAAKQLPFEQFEPRSKRICKRGESISCVRPQHNCARRQVTELS